jgi:hypothetical protein
MKKLNLIQSFVAVVTILTLARCTDPEYPAAIPSTSPSALKANLQVFHFAPDAASLNVLINNSKIGSDLSYKSAFAGYAPVVVGSAQIAATGLSGSAIGGTLGTNPLVFRAGGTNQTNFTFANSVSYSLFVTDTLKRPRPTTAGATNLGGIQFLGPVVDNLAAPAAGNASIRFYHLAAGFAPVWVTTSTGTVLFSNRSYRATSPSSGTAFNVFQSITSGTYDLQVRTGSATGSIALTVPNIRFEDGKIYTIVAGGFRSPSPGSVTKVALTANVISHN